MPLAAAVPPRHDVSVVVRVRPFMRKEGAGEGGGQALQCGVEVPADGECALPLPPGAGDDDEADPFAPKAAPQPRTKRLAFTQCLWSVPQSACEKAGVPVPAAGVAGQGTVFDSLAGCAAQNAFIGIHSTVLACGQGGAGKSYTLFGPRRVADGKGGAAAPLHLRVIRGVCGFFSGSAVGAAEEDEVGVVPRFLDAVFVRVDREFARLSPLQRAFSFGSRTSARTLSPMLSAREPLSSTLSRTTSAHSPPSSPLKAPRLPDNTRKPATVTLSCFEVTCGAELGRDLLHVPTLPPPPPPPQDGGKKGEGEEGAEEEEEEARRVYVKLNVRRDAVFGAQADVTSVEVASAEEARGVLAAALERRDGADASHRAEDPAHRAHTVIQIRVRKEPHAGVVTFVELAGPRTHFAPPAAPDTSGSASASAFATGGFAQEPGLAALLKVFKELRDPHWRAQGGLNSSAGKPSPAACGDSVLTSLLRDVVTLDNASDTTLLCAVSPHASDVEGTAKTLAYGLRARGDPASVEAAGVLEEAYPSQDNISFATSVALGRIQRQRRRGIFATSNVLASQLGQARRGRNWRKAAAVKDGGHSGEETLLSKSLAKLWANPALNRAVAWLLTSQVRFWRDDEDPSGTVRAYLVHYGQVFITEVGRGIDWIDPAPHLHTVLGKKTPRFIRWGARRRHEPMLLSCYAAAVPVVVLCAKGYPMLSANVLVTSAAAALHHLDGERKHWLHLARLCPLLGAAPAVLALFLLVEWAPKLLMAACLLACIWLTLATGHPGTYSYERYHLLWHWAWALAQTIGAVAAPSGWPAG